MADLELHPYPGDDRAYLVTGEEGGLVPRALWSVMKGKPYEADFKDKLKGWRLNKAAADHLRTHLAREGYVIEYVQPGRHLAQRGPRGPLQCRVCGGHVWPVWKPRPPAGTLCQDCGELLELIPPPR